MVGYRINQFVRTRSGETMVDSLNSELFSSTSYASGPKYFSQETPVIYNAFKDTQALMHSNDGRIRKKAKKAATTVLLLAMVACNGGGKPKDLVNVSSAISACPYPTGNSLQGNTEYEGYGSASFGQRMDFGKIEKDTSKAVTANLTSNGYLPSTLLLTLDGDYIFNVDMLRNGDIDIDKMLAYFRRGDNPRYDMPTMKIVVCPDYWVENNVTKGTGDKLPDDYTKVVVDSLTEMASDSIGGDEFTISGVDYNGTHKRDTTVPPDGEVWVFCTTYDNGVHNLTYPSGGDSVKSAKIFINPHSATASAGWHEAKDACFQEDQDKEKDNISNETLRTWYKFTFKREAGGGYILSKTREVRPQSALMNPSVSYNISQSMPRVGMFTSPEDDYEISPDMQKPRTRLLPPEQREQHGRENRGDKEK